MNYDINDSEEQKKEPILHGLGVRLIPEARSLELLFEVDDIAEDIETGAPSPAGVRITIRLNEGQEFKPIEDYEELAIKIQQQGFEELEAPPEKVRRITWDYYVSEGYAEVEEEG